MECNKDEAVRARGIAEKKMENNDFEGARKIALKAQNLYPELENITQLLSICDVHCSAQKRILGVEKDWYGILQVERLADESTVKKQYRRLALYLHPDKNRFPGAEAAFKLICEANAVLSDTGKKAAYDSKIRVSLRVNPQPHHNNKSAQFTKHFGTQVNVPNGFSGSNQHQRTYQHQPASTFVKQDVFWTSCPFCRVKYQYLREFVGRYLSCQKCSKAFVAYEETAQGVSMASKSSNKPGDQRVPSKPGTSQPADLQDKKLPKQAAFKMGAQNEKMTTEVHAPSSGTAKTKVTPPEPGIWGSEGISGANIAKETGDPKTKETSTCNANSSQNGKQGGMPNGDATNRQSAVPKNKNRKRARKLVVESSESCDISSESEVEDVTIEFDIGHPLNNLNSEPGSDVRRRSSRKRQHVTYNESDDDLANQTRANELQEDDGKEQKVAVDVEGPKHGNQKSFPADAHYSKPEGESMGTVHSEDLHNKDVNCEKEGNLRGEKGAGTAADTVEIDSDSDQESYPKENSDEDKCDCADPEFSDFEKEREEGRFKVNQFWACYDPCDGMPRFYAKVKKVSSPFKLSITWLEAVPLDEACVEWIDGDLPVGCGTYKLGSTETTSLRFTFSHLVHCEKGKKRGSLVVYPRVGEVWALFKDWDLNWSSDPVHHKEKGFKYELVEVLSNFDADVGVKVGYLTKIGGFVSLFQRISHSEADSFLIGPSELYRFSHCVPSCRMTGFEKVGVPVGSFELDPAALPLNFNDLWYADKAKGECGNEDFGVNCSPKLAKTHDKTVPSGSTSTPKKVIDLDGNDVDQSKVRRSPRASNANRKNAH